MQKEFRNFLIFTLIIVPLLIGSSVGFMEASTSYYKGGCKYENIISFFPTRAVACELVRKRF